MEDQIQEWLTAGIIFLIPKTEHTEKLKNYIHVTCLPTIQKILHVLNQGFHKYTNLKTLTSKKRKMFFRTSKNAKNKY